MAGEGGGKKNHLKAPSTAAAHMLYCINLHVNLYFIVHYRNFARL